MSGKRKQPKRAETVSEDANPKVQQPAINADYFRSVWNRSQTIGEAAQVLGLAASTCANYADRLRRAGHDLKEFQRGRPRLLKM